MEEFNYRTLLGCHRKQTLSFGEFVEEFLENPQDFLSTSPSLIAEAIKFFGYEIVIRSGEPIIGYHVFKDLLSNGINAVYGQEVCIKHILDVIESAEKEAGPNRGIVLVGPPASGKTNIVDLITLALEEYTKQNNIRLYSFYIRLGGEGPRVVELRSAFAQSPVLLFPTVMNMGDGKVARPRRDLFEHVNSSRGRYDKLPIPSYYQNATLDKRTLDILETLMQLPRNKDRTLFEILEEYVRIEEIEFSNAQAKGISNIDDMRQLRVGTRPLDAGPEALALLGEHLPGQPVYDYVGAIVDSNRGILHIHDAFGGAGEFQRESEYKPLLMLLGSGKVSVESTQTPVDNSVILTTNLEEMKELEKQLTSSKLLDRIEKVPVNYLLDANSEMDILRRDMVNLKEKYDVDPNLIRIAAYYSVMTRLLPPIKKKLPPDWSDAKKALYYSITPEQKLFIYASQPEDPVATIQKLPQWHPFRNEALRVGMNLYDVESFEKHITRHPDAVNLRNCEAFTEEQLRLIDDEFMRVLWNEHYPMEGRNGISIRQLQNVMRNTLANSDGRKVHVGIFISQLKRIINEGPELHHWLAPDKALFHQRKSPSARRLGELRLEEGEGDYADFQGLVRVVKELYHMIIRREITVATVDRDPAKIELDLRRYLQHALLARATHNKAFAHVMVPRFTFMDPMTGEKVDEPDVHYMGSIERILCPGLDPDLYRREVAQKFLDHQANGDLSLEEGKSVVSSRADQVLLYFAKEYQSLLSHRRVDGNINPEQLRDAFFQMQGGSEHFETQPAEIRDFAKNILTNMRERYHYSRKIALDTVVFALRKDIIDFKNILS